MSLINQMLQELDARRSETGGDPLGLQVRPVPPRPKTRYAWIVAGAVCGLLAIVVGLIFLRSSSRGGQPQTATSVVPATAPAAVPVATTPPSLAQGSSAGQTTAPQQVQPPQVSQMPLKLDLSLAAPVADGGNEPPGVRAGAQKAGTAAITEKKEKTKFEPAPAAEVGVPADKPPAPVPARSVKEKPVKRGASPSNETKLPESAMPERIAKEAQHGTVAAVGKQVREMTPQQRAESEYRKALQALQDNKLSEAIATSEAALRADVYHVGARYALIGMLVDAQRKDDAMARAREGLALDPAQVSLAMILARIQVEKGELRPAIDTLEKSLPYAADRGDYQAFLAALMQRDARHKQAIEHYTIALQKGAQNGVWWMGLGISLQVEHRNREAFEAFRRAKASNTLSPDLLDFVDSRLAQLAR